jgi:putative photosynthetic complex assembly protein
MPADANFPILPRWFVTGAALIMLGALGGTAAMRLSGASAQQIPDAPVQSERHLKFDDMPSGSIRVTDAVQGETILEVAPGAQSFFRGAVRALVRERKKLGIGDEYPFHLVSRTDGRLTLMDPLSKQRVDIESFGPSNAAIFVELLSRQPAHAASQAATPHVVSPHSPSPQQ